MARPPHSKGLPGNNLNKPAAGEGRPAHKRRARRQMRPINQSFPRAAPAPFVCASDEAATGRAGGRATFQDPLSADQVSRGLFQVLN